MESIFQRAELLLGAEEMAVLSGKRVILFGVGGVGSWCAEALIRTGIGHLTLVDSDVVCPSNVNRQLMATMLTIGRPKAEALRERLLEINPQADITALQKVFSEETADSFSFNDYDYVIDAIDSLKDKLLLIRRATDSTAGFFSSMGAALKMDPTRIRVAEFWRWRDARWPVLCGCASSISGSGRHGNSSVFIVTSIWKTKASNPPMR